MSGQEACQRKRLRTGFSTGTAATAAARAALRLLMTGRSPAVVAIRLPNGIYYPVQIETCGLTAGGARAVVIKDGGDDPDVTHRAEIVALVRSLSFSNGGSGNASGSATGCSLQSPGILLVAGEGVGTATKAGLSIAIGEPAINPVPRAMLVENLCEEWGRWNGQAQQAAVGPDDSGRLQEFATVATGSPGQLVRSGTFVPENREQAALSVSLTANQPGKSDEPRLKDTGWTELTASVGTESGSNRLEPSAALPLKDAGKPDRSRVVLPVPGSTGCGLSLEVEISVPKGAELARHTLNPRLGILGGISILGTTGLVKPFSHTAYEETIEAALNVAEANGCTEVVLSTGGKSERYAQTILSGYPVEAFVQIADFFGYAVGESARKGFAGIVHSVFFGKVVKMARGHHYTHAHRVAQDLRPLAGLAEQRGCPDRMCREVAEANTAREALEILLAAEARDVVEAAAREALEQSFRMAGGKLSVRLLLFNYDGSLLADVERSPHAV